MTQEDKTLLLKDLCGRLPYGVKLDNGLKLRSIDVLTKVVSCSGSDRRVDYVRPYLRPMSSMTEEERKIYMEIGSHLCGEIVAKTMIDWLNKNHFDYRGLIPIGLALEAPKDMYKTV